ncbi:tRNA (adenosine(37)-N6)-threonylcarbamoyltransferase complex ATPase subunit type 1 TsaE [Haliangium ochraceum]|uniref:tRNA threonylcarbamoyladenosine biosynthesis protein TsaE n=1 Tax=Haliangium ochraceum (strain DSM 14365 / JCM 11303 / SMP-2) TaxID=502025 RepID=D0LLA3_HALO1|nr:tRNA (adenosine(37)-N6)-threonylcarbamoyltransferase complex ATPase subunit type 1 TsaE [Haliangium ochraceum]ACY18599.1 protein of unknown function UPF0079 [Haliangium ochraceum DSM 14365]
MSEISDYVCSDPDALARAGEALASCLRDGDLIGLDGDLGAGKTLFVQGVARGLRVPPELRVVSPTFTLVNEYHGGRLSLYHADLYRIEQARELDELGLDEMCGAGEGVVCIEWSERFPVLGRRFLALRIDIPASDERRLSATAHGARAEALLGDWARALAL